MKQHSIKGLHQISPINFRPSFHKKRQPKSSRYIPRFLKKKKAHLRIVIPEVKFSFLKGGDREG